MRRRAGVRSSPRPTPPGSSATCPATTSESRPCDRERPRHAERLPRVRGGARLVPLALRAAARARLPRRRSAGSAPGRAARARAAPSCAACWSARACSSSRFTAIFVAARHDGDRPRPDADRQPLDAREDRRRRDHRDGRLLRARAVRADAEPRVAHRRARCSGPAAAARWSRAPRSRSRGRPAWDRRWPRSSGLAATQDTVAKGGGLLAVYSAGLAVPFLLTAIAFNRATTAFAWVKRHYALINGVAGVLLIAIGVLVLTRRALPPQHRGPEAARQLGPELLPGRLAAGQAYIRSGASTPSRSSTRAITRLRRSRTGRAGGPRAPPARRRPRGSRGRRRGSRRRASCA